MSEADSSSKEWICASERAAGMFSSRYAIWILLPSAWISTDFLIVLISAIASADWFTSIEWHLCTF